MNSPHSVYMRRALELAAKAKAWASPNPMVGAVIVHGNRVIGEGFHERFGGPHAEVHAIGSVSDTSLLPASTLYLNLEPCCHYGKTPPCTNLILSSGIRRVVLGCQDVYPEVSGKGIEILRSQGCEVITDVLSAECRELNRRFFTFHTSQRPYVILKWAQTSDGFIAKDDFSSKWISSEASRSLVHEWRAEESAVMVGTNTARHDNPYLSARVAGAHQPLRIIIDRLLSLTEPMNIFDSSTPTLMVHSLEKTPSPALPKVHFLPLLFDDNFISRLLSALHANDVLSVMVEGGAKLLHSFLKTELWDEIRVFTAPLQFGSGIQAPLIPKLLDLQNNIVVGEDRLLIARKPAA